MNPVNCSRNGNLPLALFALRVQWKSRFSTAANPGARGLQCSFLPKSSSYN
jgi:hypothetical protein